MSLYQPRQHNNINSLDAKTEKEPITKPESTDSSSRKKRQRDFQNVIWQLNVMVHDNLTEYAHDICLLLGVLLKSESQPSLVCMACP